MLPNRMNLTRTTEEQLKKLKGYTGVTPNVSARIAFFRSVESDFRYNFIEAKLDGSLVLDKFTWLGETSDVTELVLKMYYPELEAKQYQQAWAAHVEDGIASLRNHKSIEVLASKL
ncbi:MULTISPECIES: DNA sulfur modification protein DndE [Vibrio]|uniref:DNA sulfur modification protein DndE n=2 Tax=Vibrio tasmaniensis TaxID=212663 RepID=A0A2N7NBJ8_9VIBR|nr:DNA sulfur modification protein DndE [Vibrio tasmaniensis]OEF54003.1 DNA sulfur modification protein DndE [Vibrio tasmaniensis 1F-267]PMP08104.1 DNA sulfur modification protein DndE [Vibrio tasmaniensis]TKG36729.1 DNA sulfur modification protein DndE [Vibrio tasmaniensis]TKG38729.1 DNA sulfur modification protein DndE [Vibrio tasmaniensis]TKG47902.1 DNA sulfur modification protein DndE [Vibrio tasmaniensis]